MAIITLPIMAHVALVPLLLTVAGRDAWISAILASISGFAIIYAVIFVRVKYPKDDFRSLSTRLFGPLFGKMAAVLYGGYFLFIGILSIAVLVDMLHIAFMPETPRWASIAAFLLAVSYAASKGTRVIVLSATTLSLIAIVTGWTIPILDAGVKDWNNLRPILEYGWGPVLQGALILSSVWIELLFILATPLDTTYQRKDFWRISMVTIAFISVMSMGTTTSAITIFGFGQARNFTYPGIEVVKSLTVGFVDRFDVYSLILMTLGCYIRCALYLRVAQESFASILPKKKWKIPRLAQTSLACAGLVATGAGALFMAADHWRLGIILHLYVWCIGLAILPLVMLLAAHLRGGRQAT